MLATANISSETLAADLRESLRTILSQKHQPYLDFPSTADGPGVCICTSLADFRRVIEAEYQAKLDSRPTVPADYRAGGGRRRLPNSPVIEARRSKPIYLDVGTQTEVRPRTLAHTESAPETSTRKTKKLQRPLVSRANPESTRAAASQSCTPASSTASSPCTWEKATRKPVGPIWGPEDLISGWVPKRKPKRKGVDLPLPAAKKLAAGNPSKPRSKEVVDSDADDEDDEDKERVDENQADDDQQVAEEQPDDQGSAEDQQDDQESVEDQQDDQESAEDQQDDQRHQDQEEDQTNNYQDGERVANAPAPATSVSGVVSSVEVLIEAPSVPVLPSSQDSASSPSGSDRLNQVATAEKDAKATLHRVELATNVQVSQKHRRALISQSLAFAGRDALESFRQACSYWRSDYVSKMSEGLAVKQLDIERHPVLERFSSAYSSAIDTTLRRAVLDILHRINLAYLYEVYLETLEALSHFSLQQRASRSNAGYPALTVFDREVCDVAQDQMFWACYPEHAGKPRNGIDRAFKATLANAKKWHTLREEFTIGMLALVPPGANNWFEKLPLAYLPVYFQLTRAVNPMAVSTGELISDRVFSSWRGEEPPKQLLRIEHLEAVDETYLRANPLKLLEEINVGCIPGVPTGRAVTVPVGVDENDATALNAVFSPMPGLPQGGSDEYELPPGFFDGVDFLGETAA